MSFCSIAIEHVRNLNKVEFQPAQGINILAGNNGSGKTSILESMYIMAFGRSFRARQLKQAIENQADYLRIVANCNVYKQLDTESTIVGYERSRSGDYQVRVAGQAVDSIADVASMLPISLLNIKNYQLLTDSPSSRRKLLDWGVFHVEHQFLFHWKQLNRLLRQRNALLKEGQCTRSGLMCWDESLKSACLTVHAMRERFAMAWFKAFIGEIESIFPQYSFQMSYNPGWNIERDLMEIWSAAFVRDRLIGSTQYAAHRADFSMLVDGVPAAQVLSTGQQKTVITILQLVQTKYVAEISQKRPVYLIDDLPAELDLHAKSMLFKALKEMDSQVFITCIEPEAFSRQLGEDAAKMFYVEHGNVKEMV